MEVKAQLNHLHIAPRKVRLVADMIRNMDARQALAALEAMPKRASAPLAKLLRSALANAEHNFQAGSQIFYIKRVFVDPGPVGKRFRPRAFGRAATIRKRTSHVSLFLDTRGEVADARPAGVKQLAPVVRDRAPEDNSQSPHAARLAARGRGTEAGKPAKPKVSSVVRRMFQRKVV